MDILRITEFGKWGPEGTNRWNWNYNRWLNAVKHTLRTIGTTRAGRIVLEELIRIAGREKKITIMAGPLQPTPGTHQAGVIPHWDQTGVDINFTPMTWRDPAAVLLHELFHAIGELNLTSAWDYQTLKDQFHAKGELVAIAIANLYRLEKGHKLLRVDHLSPTETKWRVPREATWFFADHHDVFVDMRGRRSGLSARLGEIVPTGYKDHLYNPFRAAADPRLIASVLEGIRNRRALDDLFAPPP